MFVPLEDPLLLKEKQKKIGKAFQKMSKGQKKSSLLEFGRKHFFAGDSWLYHIPAQLC